MAGFIDEVNPQRKGETLLGNPILGGNEALPALFDSGIGHAIVGIGDGPARIRIGHMLANMGYELINAIHPTAVVARDVQIGNGCVVAAQAAVNPGAVLADHVIVNTGATVDHECRIGNAVHIGPGVHLAGKVSVGERTWIGIGSTVIDRIVIGADAFIGAGSVVVKDIPDAVLAYGVPARVIKETPK